MKIGGIYKKLVPWLVIFLVILGVGYAVYYYGWVEFPHDNYQMSCEQVDNPRAIRFPNGKTISARVADTAFQRTQGLSGSSNPINKEIGMLFIFDNNGIQSMWMKGMLFNLDMIWLDENYRIVHLEKNIKAPGFAVEDARLQIFQNTVPAKYVLEVTAGVSEQNHLSLGDQLGVSQGKLCVTF